VLEIKDSYYDRISKLPLNYKICKYKFKVPHFICTFDRYLEICKEFNKVAVIEIKQAGLDETALTLLVDKVKKANMLNKTHFISFDWESLKKVQLIETKSTVFALADTEQKIQSALDFGFNISIRGNLINKKIMKTVHEKHLLISV
jgi:glycerophosphoryl diester phosphodiesterase